MRVCGRLAALAVALGLAGCGVQGPAERTTPIAPATPVGAAPLVQPPVTPNVPGEPVSRSALTDLLVTLPRPAGWEPHDGDPSTPHAELIAKNNSYPTAMLIVYRLSGGVDPAGAIRRAIAALPPDFAKLNESTDDFRGFPSAMVEGNRTGPDGRRMHTYHRAVVPVTAAGQRYLVQLTVTGLAKQVVQDSDDIAEIIGGFDVTVR